MSTNTSNDTQANGHGLPESTERRLRKLQEYVTFLTHVVRPGRTDGETAEIGADEWATCLKQLEQRVAPVMEALSQAVERGEDTVTSAPDAALKARETEHREATGMDAEAASIPMSPSGERYTSGITLEQIDQINLLLESLRALGNVVYCADHAEYSKATLTIMGDAIYRDVDKMHDIVDAIYESQRFGPKYELNSVREASASYLALPAHSPRGGSSYLSQPHPTYQ